MHPHGSGFLSRALILQCTLRNYADVLIFRQPGEWLLICNRLGMYLCVQLTDLEAIRGVKSDVGMWGISARVLT